MPPSVIAYEGDRFGVAQYRSSARDAEARKILDAARLVLERSRFRSLKVRQVLAASHTSASNFYRRFPSKSHLMLALLEDEVRLVDRWLADRIDTTAPVTDQLRTWLRYNMGAACDQSRSQRTSLFRDHDLIMEFPEQVHILYGIIDRRLYEIIRRGIDAGELRPGNPETDAMLVGRLVRGLPASGAHTGLPHEDDDLVTRVYTFVSSALGIQAPVANNDRC